MRNKEGSAKSSDLFEDQNVSQEIVERNVLAQKL
jgi:hypothetical protein